MDFDGWSNDEMILVCAGGAVGDGTGGIGGGERNAGFGTDGGRNILKKITL